MKDTKQKIILRVRSKISGTESRPRLAVFKSNTHIYGQLIDDTKGLTLVAASDKEIKDAKNKQSLYSAENKPEEVGKLLAVKALKKDIKTAVFDRRSYQYHGVVKSFAEGARAGGLKI